MPINWQRFLVSAAYPKILIDTGKRNAFRILTIQNNKDPNFIRSELLPFRISIFRTLTVQDFHFQNLNRLCY